MAVLAVPRLKTLLVMLMAELFETDIPVPAFRNVKFRIVTDETLVRFAVPERKVPEVLLPMIDMLLMGVNGSE